MLLKACFFLFLLTIASATESSLASEETFSYSTQSTDSPLTSEETWDTSTYSTQSSESSEAILPTESSEETWDTATFSTQSSESNQNTATLSTQSSESDPYTTQSSESSTSEETWDTVTYSTQSSESDPYTSSWYTEQTTSSPQGPIGGFGIMVRPNGGSFIMPLMPIGAGSAIRFTAEWLVGADNIDFHVAIPVQIPGAVLYQLSIRSGWINGVFYNEIAQNSKNMYNQWEYEVVSNPIVIAQGQPFTVNVVFLSNYHVQTIIEHTNAKTTYSPFYLRTSLVADQENYLEFGANSASTATVVISNIQFEGSSNQPSYSYGPTATYY